MSDTVNRSAGATHGKPFAPSFHETPATETTFRSEVAAESEGKKLALSFLNEAIDGSGLPRKQVADTVGKSEATFSKMTTAGPNAQAFGLDAFEQLPVAIQVAWLKRYARALGLEVRELDALQVAEAIVERFEEFSRFVRMFQIGRSRMAHASIPERGERRARA